MRYDVSLVTERLMNQPIRVVSEGYSGFEVRFIRFQQLR